jgi:hypothetical protein
LPFRFAYDLPWWGWALGILAVLMLAVGAYRHARPLLAPSRWLVLVTLRALTLALIGLVLLRPVRLEPAPAATGRTVAVVIDDSRSMRLRGEDAASRLEQATQLVEGRLRPALAADFSVRLFAMADALREITTTDALDGSGQASDLPGLLPRLSERASAGELVAAVLVSDGASSTPLEATTGTAVMPLFTVGVGQAGAVVDREVRDVTVSDVSVVDSLAEVSATVVSHGEARETVDVRLLENGRPVDVRQVVLPGRSQQVRERFRVTPSRTTATVYTVEVADAPGELTADNNRGAVFVPVPGPPHPVLVLQGGPGFEHGFLTRILGRDPGLDVDGVVTKGRTPDDQPTFYVQGSASRTPYLLEGFPPDTARLFTYAAVVLANVEADQLTRAQLDALRAFVERRGGGLAVIGARSFGDRGVVTSGLGDIVPVEPRGGGAANAAAGGSGRDGTRITLTGAGRAHPLMQLVPDGAASLQQWESLPSLAAATAVGPPRPGAEVLATVAGPAGDPQPLVAVQRIGRGRTLAFMGEGAWRWRMGLPSDNRVYETFWRQAVRWLAIQAPSQVAVTAGAPSVGTTTDVAVRVVDEEYEPIGDASVSLRVREPGGATRTVAAVLDPREAGTYRAAFLPVTAGVHTLEAEAQRAGRQVGRAEVSVLAGGADPELVDPRRNDAVLARLGDASGGALLTPAEIDDLASRIKEAVATPTARTVQRDLWHNAWTFLVMVSLLGTEWALRRRWGLR